MSTSLSAGMYTFSVTRATEGTRGGRALGPSAGDDGPDHHERKYHEQQDQAQFRVVRHLMLRAGPCHTQARCNNMPGEGPQACDRDHTLSFRPLESCASSADPASLSRLPASRIYLLVSKACISNLQAIL